MEDDYQKTYPCSRCGKVSQSPDTTWRVRYDIWSADLNGCYNQKVLCTNCCMAFQEQFMNEVNDKNQKTLSNFFSNL